MKTNFFIIKDNQQTYKMSQELSTESRRNIIKFVGNPHGFIVGQKPTHHTWMCDFCEKICRSKIREGREVFKTEEDHEDYYCQGTMSGRDYQYLYSKIGKYL